MCLIPLLLAACFAPSRKSADPRVAAVAAEYRRRLPELVAEMALPHQLLPSRRGAAPVRPPGLRGQLEAVFEPLGYNFDRRDARAGILRLEKKTGTGIRLALAFDLGSRSQPSVSTLFFVDLGETYETFNVPAASAVADYLQYPIRSTGEWRRILENQAAIVEHLENDLVPRLERAATD